MLLTANLGERAVGWRVAAYVMLLGVAVALAFLSVVTVALIVFKGPVASTGAASGPRQIGGALVLFVAGVLAAVSLLPPLRGVAARLLPSFRADSAVHAVSLGLYFATLLVFASLQISTDQLKEISATGQSPSLVVIIASNQLPMLIVAVIGVGFLTRRSVGEAAQRLGLYWPGFRWIGASLAAAVLLVIFGAVFEQVMSKITPQQSHDIQQVSDQLLKNVNGYGAAIALALAAGIGEELLFRGALLPRLGNPLSALLFAALHAQYAVSLATLEIFILGLVLGWLRRRAGTTGAIIAHSGYDMILLVIAVAFAGH